MLLKHEPVEVDVLEDVEKSDCRIHIRVLEVQRPLNQDGHVQHVLLDLKQGDLEGRTGPCQHV